MERFRGKLYRDVQQARLVYRSQKATSEFWDSLWRDKHAADLVRPLSRRGSFVTNTTIEFLPPGAAILEGGCGTGLHARHLSELGYEVTSLDWAVETIHWLAENIPTIKPVLGDIRRMPFKDAEFDGYWSLGVIEHFFEGYGEVHDEMRRVIKPGGYLFLTFPHMSLARRFGARLGYFPPWEDAMKDEFYQFALDADQVIRDFAPSFALVKRSVLLGAAGFADTFPLAEPLSMLCGNRMGGRRSSSPRSIEFRRLYSLTLHCWFCKENDQA